MLVKQKQDDAATALLHEIAQRDHSPWTEMALLELGDDATVMGRNQQAFEMYDLVVQRYPNSSLRSHAQLGRGHALYQLGRYEDAQRALAEAAANKDLAPEARHWMAEAQKAQKQWNAAADTLSATLQNRAKSDVTAPVLEQMPQFHRLAAPCRRKSPSRNRWSKRSVPWSTPSVLPNRRKNRRSLDRRKMPAASDAPYEAGTAEAEVSVEIQNDVAAAKPIAPQHVAEKPPAQKAALVDDQQRRRAAMNRYQAAEAMIRAGDYRRAIGTLEVVDQTADDPASLGNRYLLSISLQAVKRNDDAMATLRDLSKAIDIKIASIATDRSDEPTGSAETASSDDLVALRSLRGNVLLAQATSLVAAEKFADAVDPLQQYLAMGRQDVGAERASSALVVCFAAHRSPRRSPRSSQRFPSEVSPTAR